MKKRIPRLIGVVHLPPLPGSIGTKNFTPYDLLQRGGYWAVQEAKMLQKCGFEAIIIENFGDQPFFGESVPPETIASLAVICSALKSVVNIPIGVNVLRNDAKAAMAVAAVTGCEFIRVNVLAGVVATDQGWIEGKAAELIRRRRELGAEVAILADVHVKHAQTLSSVEIGSAAIDLVRRSGADGLIVTGPSTGNAPDLKQVQDVVKAVKGSGIPVYVGSGSNTTNLKQILDLADGVIVSSNLRTKGVAGEPLDLKRTKQFARAFQQHA